MGLQEVQDRWDSPLEKIKGHNEKNRLYTTTFPIKPMLKMHSFCLILSSMSHALLELRLLPVNHLSFQGVKVNHTEKNYNNKIMS